MFNIIKVKSDTLYLLEKINLDKECNILYGAGSFGRECLMLLQEQKVKIDYFCDDDCNKWGKKVKGIEVIPSKKLNSINKKINLFMTSIYAKQIYKKLPRINNMNIYELFSIAGTNQGLANDFMNITDLQVSEILKKLPVLESIFKDITSVKTLHTLCGAILNKNNDIAVIEDIVSNEECYFINEVKDAWKETNEKVVVDGGAYIGEIAGNMEELGLPYNKIYCFEVEDSNFKILKKNAKDRIVCVNKGMWNTNGYVYIEPNGTATKIVDYQTEYKMNVITIDEYFKDIPVGLIKMDIEGAETNALLGGMNVIKRDRPILAISIYHSVNDFFNLPLFLNENLENYIFYLRHHSMIFSETVLYCIPKERFNNG